MNIHARRKCCFPVTLVSAEVWEGGKAGPAWVQESGSVILMFSCPHGSNAIKRELTALLFMRKDTDNCEIKWTWPVWYKCLCRLGSEYNI